MYRNLRFESRYICRKHYFRAIDKLSEMWLKQFDRTPIPLSFQHRNASLHKQAPIHQPQSVTCFKYLNETANANAKFVMERAIGWMHSCLFHWESWEREWQNPTGYRLIAVQNKYIDIDRKLSVKFHMRIGKHIHIVSVSVWHRMRWHRNELNDKIHQTY